MQGTGFRDVRKARSCGSDSRVGFSQLPFWCFGVKNRTASLDCSLLGLGERKGREGTGRGQEEGSDEPSALEGSLAAGGGHSGRGPAVGFARLAAGLLLPHSFPSQVTGGRAGGGLGRLRVLRTPALWP